MRKNIFITLEYDGTRYNGWQKQGNTDNTIQGKLEAMLTRMFRQQVLLNGAGRTDKGVHAMGQTANFHVDTELSPREIMEQMNALLPRDIAVKDAMEANPRFHARLNAAGKTYRYQILTGGEKSAFLDRYAWSVPSSLDVAAMTAWSEGLLGRHDFLAMSDLKKSKKSTQRRIDKVDIRRRGKLVTIDITGDGFLYHMVRIIVAALVSVGEHTLQEEALHRILVDLDRSAAPAPAPAKGLTLLKTYYSKEI